MAYLREEKEDVEIDYSLDAIWKAIPKAIEKLHWKIEEKNETAHKLSVKTKGAFLSYPSSMKIEVAKVDQKLSRMFISAETPVTTITSMADIGRTRDRIEKFIVTLAKLMEKSKIS